MITLFLGCFSFSSFIFVMFGRFSENVTVAGEKFWLNLVIFLIIEFVCVLGIELITALVVLVKGKELFNDTSYSMVGNLVEYIGVVISLCIMSEMNIGISVSGIHIIIVSFFLYIGNRISINVAFGKRRSRIGEES